LYSISLAFREGSQDSIAAIQNHWDGDGGYIVHIPSYSAYPKLLHIIANGSWEISLDDPESCYWHILGSRSMILVGKQIDR